MSSSCISISSCINKTVDYHFSHGTVLHIVPEEESTESAASVQGPRLAEKPERTIPDGM